MNIEFLMRPYVIWFLVGLFLLLLELATPGLVVMFFGIGAWITSFVCFVTNIKVNTQLIIFVSVSVVSLALLRKLLKDKLLKNTNEESESFLDEFTGKKAVAQSDIEKNGQGRVEYKGTSWIAESDFDIKKGSNVVIESKDSTVLKVKPSE